MTDNVRCLLLIVCGPTTTLVTCAKKWLEPKCPQTFCIRTHACVCGACSVNTPRTIASVYSSNLVTVRARENFRTKEL